MKTILPLCNLIAAAILAWSCAAISYVRYVSFNGYSVPLPVFASAAIESLAGWQVVEDGGEISYNIYITSADPNRPWFELWRQTEYPMQITSTQKGHPFDRKPVKDETEPERKIRFYVANWTIHAPENAARSGIDFSQDERVYVNYAQCKKGRLAVFDKDGNVVSEQVFDVPESATILVQGDNKLEL